MPLIITWAVRIIKVILGQEFYLVNLGVRILCAD